MQQHSTMAIERWNVQKKQNEFDNSLMEFYEKQVQACKISEHSSNKKAEALYNKISSDIKWSYPPIAGVHANLILEYCRHLISCGSYQQFPKEMDLRSWNVKVKGTLQEKGVEKMKILYTRLFRLVSRRDNMITMSNNTLMLTSEKMKIRNEGSLRWMMEKNHGKKDEYFSIWYLSRMNKLRELQVLFSSKNKMNEYGEAGVNCADPDFGLTALHYACRESHFDIVQFLLQQGADVRIAAPDGRTPLHFSAAYGSREIVLSLLGAGSIATQRDNNGSTPLDLARQNQNQKTLPTLIHWEELMDFKGDGDDEAILQSLETSANFHDASQGIDSIVKSTFFRVESVDKIPESSRSFILGASSQFRNQQSSIFPSSHSSSKWKDDNEDAVPWEFATVAAADFQKMSRELQFLVQRLNGFNPFLLKQQQQLFEQQNQQWETQAANPNYQQQLYMSQTNWPAVTSNMMQTHSFAWNSWMGSLPYNPRLHAGSQSLLMANFPDSQQPQHADVSFSSNDSIIRANNTLRSQIGGVSVGDSPERVIIQGHKNDVYNMNSAGDEEQRRIDLELQALGVSYAGNGNYDDTKQFDKDEVRNNYLTEIRLCTKYFILCTKEGITSEAVRILHRRWTVAKKLYDLVARREDPLAPSSPFSQLLSPSSGDNPRRFGGYRDEVTSPVSMDDLFDPFPSQGINTSGAFVPIDSAPSEFAEQQKVSPIRFQHCVDQDDDVASAVSAMTADFEEDMFGGKQLSHPSAEPIPPVQTDHPVEEIHYDGSREPVRLEKLASDFLSTFTIIDYLPETPGVVDQKSGSKETKVPNVERLSEKIFIETDQLRSKSSPSTAISTDNVGMAIDENSAKSMEPKDIIRKLLQRYANEEHRARLLEYAWRYENQELLDHYTTLSSTAAASQSLSSAISADRRYRERMVSKYPSGPPVVSTLGGGLGPQPADLVPGVNQLMYLGSSGQHTMIASSQPYAFSGASVVSRLTGPSTILASRKSPSGRHNNHLHNPQFGFVSASKLHQLRQDHNIGMATNLAGDENSTIVSLTSWDLSIQRHYQQHPLPQYLPENNYMSPFFPLTELEKYAENYVLMQGMEFIEVLLVQKEYDQALLCLEDCLRLHDGVLITMRIRVIFQLCDLILYLCDTCWEIESDANEDSQLDDYHLSNLMEHSTAPKKGEATFSPYSSTVVSPSFSMSVISQKPNMDGQLSSKNGVLTSSTTQLPPLKSCSVAAAQRSSQSMPNTPIRKLNKHPTTASSASLDDELDPEKWLAKTLGSPSSLASTKGKKAKSLASLSSKAKPSSQSSKVSSRPSIQLNLSSNSVSARSRLSTLPAIDAKIVHEYVSGPAQRRRKKHVLDAQQNNWPEKIALIEAQWDEIRQLPSLSVRNTLQTSAASPSQTQESHVGEGRSQNVAIVRDRLYWKLLQRCLTVAQEAIDLGSVLSSRHVFEPLFIAQAMGYVGLAHERLGDVQEAWEMLEQASLIASRVAYAGTTTIELMLDSLRIFVKYQCRNDAQLVWVSKKAAEINQMIKVYAPTSSDSQADKWWRKSAEWLAIATMTVRDPDYRITGHEAATIRFQDKNTTESIKRRIRYL
jgi:hypothetical protein